MDERKELLSKRKVECSRLRTPPKLSEWLDHYWIKRKIKGGAPSEPHIPKTLKLEVDFSPASKGNEVQVNVVEGAAVHTSLTRKGLPLQSSMWNDPNFDAIKFIGVRLPFLEDFKGEYKFINSHMLLKISNIKETRLLMVMLIEHVDREKHAQTENKLTSKLTGCQWDNVKGQAIIEVLQKEKETLMTKLQEAKIKDEEFVTS